MMSMCGLLLCFWKRVFTLTSAFSWQNSISLCPCFILYSKAKFASYSRYLLTSYFCIPIPNDEKDVFFLVLVLEDLVGPHRTVHLQLLQHCSSGHRLGLLWYWMVCLRNKQIILSFLRLHPSTAFWALVDYEGNSISSKGFLPTVVDIMVIWVKSTHSSPF